MRRFSTLKGFAWQELHSKIKHIEIETNFIEIERKATMGIKTTIEQVVLSNIWYAYVHFKCFLLLSHLNIFCRYAESKTNIILHFLGSI